MACNCGCNNCSSQLIENELGLWPLDWIYKQAEEFCVNAALEKLTPAFLLIVAILLILILGGRLTWVKQNCN
ncbi:hypothetical protein EHQ61_16375 [Leptospira wolffii]|nr:hypothetical protein [Leptospira wolffii]TGL46327.1 hypothetical protein EHQ61_16375 [Leptospira wolffii]